MKLGNFNLALATSGGQTATCAAGSWAGEGVTYTYFWYADGIPQPPSAGSTSPSFAIPDALTRTTPLVDNGITLAQGGSLVQPLGLTLAPNGDLLSTNAGDGNIVETTPAGKQVAWAAADAKAGAGSLFGLAVAPGGKGVYFVDDASNALELLH